MIIEEATGTGEVLEISAVTPNSTAIFDGTEYIYDVSSGREFIQTSPFTSIGPFEDVYFIYNNGYTDNQADIFGVFETSLRASFQFLLLPETAAQDLSLDFVTYLINEDYSDTITLAQAQALDKTLISKKSFSLGATQTNSKSISLDCRFDISGSATSSSGYIRVASGSRSGYGYLHGLENISNGGSIAGVRLYSRVDAFLKEERSLFFQES